MMQGTPRPNRPRDPEIDLDLLAEHDGHTDDPVNQPVTGMHHIYSSANGYRTLFASPRLQLLQGKLEEWARKQCTDPAVNTRWYSFALDDAHWMISKAFKAGVDRAGRPRKCVHSIVFDRHELWTNWREFNPARMPAEWFLGPNAKLDESALKEQLPDRLTPPVRPEVARGRGARSFAVDQGQLVQALLYAPAGMIAVNREGLPPEQLAEMFDWLPFAYRLRWAIGSTIIPDPGLPCQILLGAETAAGNAEGPPLLGSGWPVTLKDSNFDTGVWDHWLFRGESQLPTAFRHFHRWFAQLNLHRAPTPDEENWLLAAFQCLRPLEPIEKSITDIDYKRTPQVILGVLFLGWGNQPGAAVAKLAEFGNALIARRRFNALAHLIEQTWLATYHRPGPIPVTEQARQRLNTKLIAIAENANPHAHVLQTVWALFSAARVIGYAAYQSPQLPLPDLRCGVSLWNGERRSLLWMNLVILCNHAIQQMTHVGGSLFTTDEQKEALLRLSNQLATFNKYRELFAHSHQWLFDEMSGPMATPAQAIRLLDILRQTGFEPDKIDPIKDRLRRFTNL